MLVPTVDSINGVRMRRTAVRREYTPRHTQSHNELRIAAHPRRRLATAVALCLLSVVVMSASAPSTFAASTPARPLHAGVAQLDPSADACIATMWKLIADKSEGRPSESGVECPGCGKPYLYSQYLGVTTISCPEPARHDATSISVRSDTKVPVAR